MTRKQDLKRRHYICSGVVRQKNRKIESISQLKTRKMANAPFVPVTAKQRKNLTNQHLHRIIHILTKGERKREREKKKNFCCNHGETDKCSKHKFIVQK